MSLDRNGRIASHDQRVQALGERISWELLAGALAASGVVGVALDSSLPIPGWFIAVAAIALLRYGMARLCRALQPLAARPGVWLTQYYAGCALTSLAWGWLGWTAVTSLELETFAWLMVLDTGLCLAVLGLYPSVLAAFALYSVLGLLPPVLAVLRAGEPLVVPLGVLATLFAGYAICTGIYYRRQRIDALRGAQEASDLRRELAVANGELARLRVAHKSSSQALVSTQVTLGALRERLGSAEGLARALSERVEHGTLVSEDAGIPNRRAFDQALSREWQRMSRARKPLSLVLFDLDDTEGAGELQGAVPVPALVKGMARVLTGFGQRAGDLAAHDERGRFLLLLPEADSKNAVRIAQQLHGAIAAARLPIDPSQSEPCATVHVGVATLIPNSHLNPEELVARADSALYEASFQGGNRVVTYRALRDLRIERWTPKVDGLLSGRALVNKLALWEIRPEPVVCQGDLAIADQVHDAVAVLALPSGRLQVHVEGESLGLQAGDCLFLPAGTTYSAEAVSAGPVTLLRGLAGKAVLSPEVKRAV